MTDWLVFGDDWDAHPSTTQHLVRQLPATDRVIWVNSIGMRKPRPALTDLRRVLDRLTPQAATPFGQPQPVRPHLTVAQFNALPWHDSTAAVAINRVRLHRAIANASQQLGISGPLVALVSNPCAWPYLAGLPIQRLVYLRLDDYPRLPGVDADMIRPLERRMVERSDLIVVTARQLAPCGGAPVAYLPQGVDVDHFSSTSFGPRKEKVLGFFGLLAEWVDWDLVMGVARLCSDWTLEFVGPVRYRPDSLADLPNVRLRDGVPYSELPAAIAGWSAGWIPFELTEMTQGVNPLKAREYLAAGLAVASTALPEVLSLATETDLRVVWSVDDMQRWLSAVDISAEAVQQRRDVMVDHSWAARSRELAGMVAQ